MLIHLIKYKLRKIVQNCAILRTHCVYPFYTTTGSAKLRKKLRKIAQKNSRNFVIFLFTTNGNSSIINFYRLLP